VKGSARRDGVFGAARDCVLGLRQAKNEILIECLFIQSPVTVVTNGQAWSGSAGSLSGILFTGDIPVAVPVSRIPSLRGEWFSRPFRFLFLNPRVRIFIGDRSGMTFFCKNRSINVMRPRWFARILLPASLLLAWQVPLCVPTSLSSPMATG
jgi:hypothetical protein